MEQLRWKEDTRTPEQLDKLCEQADRQAQSELGSALELVQIGDVATTDYLLDEISIIERLDGMIDRCLKRLLLVRGVKSLSSSARPRQSSEGLVCMESGSEEIGSAAKNEPNRGPGKGSAT